MPKRKTAVAKLTTPVKKLKLVLSGSSSSSKSSVELPADDNEDDLVLSGYESEPQSGQSEEIDMEEDEELLLESSPVRTSPRKHSKIKLKLTSSEETQNYDDDNDCDDGDDGEEGGEVEEDQPSSQRLTARQRALLSNPEPTPVLLTHLKAKPELSEEELLRRAEKTRKRQHLRDQKLEESKQATIQRLLQKQGSKSKKMRDASADGLHSNESAVMEEKPFEGIRYIDTMEATQLLITNDALFTALFGGHHSPTSIKTKCSSPGCSHPRKYTTAKTNMPVCSLECYRKVNK